ncbi:sensor histidine kinase [Marinobacterium zhoushanense]|uniref:sensor histidine kinase n=1 Tax=Marinobacterium zhoushanense TaxID=1679163 RepID=UPI001E3296D9|nr:HAMP domain-containing sensor histidine kinase [Marinobacterium zhoushanense]
MAKRSTGRRKSQPHLFRRSSLARRYLLSSLLIALIPLLLLAGVYDALYVRALNKVAESRTNARMAATENLLASFLQERLFELQELIDDPVLSDYLGSTRTGALLPDAVDRTLRRQLDSPYVYGVILKRRFTSAPEWYLPQSLRVGIDLGTLPITPLRDAELLGPVSPNVDRPGWLVLKLGLNQSDNPEQAAWLGLVLRLTSFTDRMRDLELQGLQQPLLRAPNGVYLSQLGTQVDPHAALSERDDVGAEFLPGWNIRLLWLGDPLYSPLELARFGLLLLVFASAIGIVWLARHLSRRLSDQITPLIEGAERVAGGDFDTPLNIRGTAEIGVLALAQERMRLRLKRLIRGMVEVERRAVLGQFAAGVAHEIRNPLATIKTSVQALSRKETEPHRLELMQMVSHEIDRTNDVVQLLLDYARPRQAEANRINLQELIDSVKVLADGIAHSHGIQIETVAHDKAVYAWADPAQVRQIIMNLVMNSIQAMETMGGTVRLQARRQGLSAYLFVKDNGPGVSQEQLAYLTEPFYTTKSSGTGLGLSICSQLAHSNDGKLTFRSVSGQGMRVSLRLPLYTTDREKLERHE